MTDVTENLPALKDEALNAIAEASDLSALDAVRVAELGKKGRISGLMKTLGKMSPEERQEMGPRLNGLRNEVAAAIDARKAAATSSGTGGCSPSSHAGLRGNRRDFW